MILTILKNIPYSDKLTRSGNFSFYEFYRSELYGKKVGVIGFGKVGSRVGRYLKAFGAEVIANDIDSSMIKKNKSFNFKPLSYLLKKSDIITLHIPYNSKNYHFLDDYKFSKMKEGVIFINTSRGSVVDEESLITNLKKRKVLFAGLDVFENEPNINPEFFSLKNVIITNHIAGKTPESEKKILLEIFEKLNKLFYNYH